MNTWLHHITAFPESARWITSYSELKTRVSGGGEYHGRYTRLGRLYEAGKIQKRPLQRQLTQSPRGGENRARTLREVDMGS